MRARALTPVALLLTVPILFPLTAESFRVLYAEEEAPLLEEMNSESRAAIEQGLRFLTRSMLTSGQLGERHPVATTAIGCIAFMANGSTPDRGPYAQYIRKGLNFLIRKQGPSGYIDDGESRMYGHGFATLCLAEAYGQSRREEHKTALRKAIRLMTSSQDASGGWVYHPQPSGQSDISITVCQTMALRAARNVGIAIDLEVIDRAYACVKRAQTSDGGFAYRVGLSAGGWRGSAYPRSAGGLCILYHLGQYEDEAIADGIEYLLAHRSDGNDDFYYYAQYYAAQAYFQAGGQVWRDTWPSIRDALVDRQRQDGSWTGNRSDEKYCTSMALVVLQIPYRYLPIFER